MKWKSWNSSKEKHIGGGGGLWASNIPLKTILTFWFAINNKLLSWENLRKRGFQGLCICILCKSGEELTSHLFGLCPYAGKVWTNALRAITHGRILGGKNQILVEQ